MSELLKKATALITGVDAQSPTNGRTSKAIGIVTGTVNKRREERRVDSPKVDRLVYGEMAKLVLQVSPSSIRNKHKVICPSCC